MTQSCYSWECAQEKGRHTFYIQKLYLKFCSSFSFSSPQSGNNTNRDQRLMNGTAVEYPHSTKKKK